MITLLTAPTASSYVPAGNPVWIRAQSDAAEANYTITAVADSSGSVQLTAVSFAGVLANSVLLISGATGTYAYLNGRRNVVAAAATTVVIDLAFVAVTTGTMGVARNLLEKFSMGVDNQYDIDGDDFEIATHYAPFLTGIGIKDISRIIQGVFESVFSLTAKWTSELNKGFYTIETAVYEAALSATYGRVPLDSEPFTWYSVWANDITGRILATGSQLKLLNSRTSYKLHPGTKFIMSALTTDSVIDAYYSYNTGLVVDGADLLTADQFKANYVFEMPTGSGNVSLYVRDSATLRISEIITLTPLAGSGCGKYPVYWRNRYGGYDVYEFVEIAETVSTGNRTQVQGQEVAMGAFVDKDFSTEAYETIKVVGRNEPAQDSEYLRDMLTSSEIFDSAGSRIKLLTAELITVSRENVKPEFTFLINRRRSSC